MNCKLLLIVSLINMSDSGLYVYRLVHDRMLNIGIPVVGVNDQCVVIPTCVCYLLTDGHSLEKMG